MIKDIKNCTILYNPVSSGFSINKLNSIYDTVKENGLTADVIASKEQGNITKLIMETDKESELIITLGGDGTVSEAYKGFNMIKQQGLYAHVPTGTANDMAKNYNVRYKDAGKITEDILNGEIAKMDSFKVNDEFVAYTSVFGYLAHVPFKTPRGFKKIFKTGSYVATAAPYLLKAPVKYNISYETENISGNTSCILGAVSNSKGFAGIDLYKDALLDDGRLELLLITEANAKLISSIVKDYLKNDIDIRKYKDYLVLDKARKIKLTFNDVYPKYVFDNDGEKSLVLPNKDNPTVTFEVANQIKVLKRKGN